MPRPPARKKRKRKQRRRKSGVKIAIAVTLCIAAVAALGTGIYFIVDQVATKRQQQKSDGATSSDVRVHTFGQITFECPKAFISKAANDDEIDVADEERSLNIWCQNHPIPDSVGSTPDDKLKYFVNWCREIKLSVLSSRVVNHKNGFQFILVETEVDRFTDGIAFRFHDWMLLIPTPDGKSVKFQTSVVTSETPWSEAKPIFQKIVDSIRIKK